MTTTPNEILQDLIRQKLAESLAAKPTHYDLNASSDSEAFCDDPDVPVTSDTALVIDSWSKRRGREFSETPEAVALFDSLATEALTDKDIDLVAADCLAAAWEPKPKLADNPSEGIAKKRSEFFTALFETDAYKRLHARTRLDALASEIAAVSFTKKILEVIEREEQKDPDNPGPGDGEEGDGDLEREGQSFGDAIDACDDAAEAVESLEDMERGLGTGDGKSNSIDMAKVRQNFNRVRNSPSLRVIIEKSGRWLRIAQSLQANKPCHGPDEVCDIVHGNDLNRVLGSELAFLDDEDLEDLFYLRYVESSLQLRETRAFESEARGPIVIVVDESGSMAGDRIVQAKAMALAMLWIAESQKRWCCMLGFSGSEEGNYLTIEPGKKDTDALLDWLEHFYDGGTDMDVPLVELPSKWSELGCPVGKTDIIQITDAKVEAPEKVINNFNKWKLANQVKMNTIVIGSRPGDLERVSDNVFMIRDLNIDSAGVNECLSI